MKKEEIENLVFQTIAQVTLRPAATIERATYLEADLGLDSITLASLTAKFENIISCHPEIHKLTTALLGASTVGEFIDLLQWETHEKV